MSSFEENSRKYIHTKRFCSLVELFDAEKLLTFVGIEGNVDFVVGFNGGVVENVALVVDAADCGDIVVVNFGTTYIVGSDIVGLDDVGCGAIDVVDSDTFGCDVVSCGAEDDVGSDVVDSNDVGSDVVDSDDVIDSDDVGSDVVDSDVVGWKVTDAVVVMVGVVVVVGDVVVVVNGFSVKRQFSP